MDAYKIAVSDFPLDGKLPPGDTRWPKFNASFHNMELSPGRLMDNIYYGRPITTHHKNNWRTGENYLLGQHIGLDFDTEDERSTLARLSSDKFIQKYASFVHTTISHTAEAPRARVIFLLDQPIYQAKNYALSAQALLWLFGMADPKCKDAVRFFYGAQNCEFEYIGQVLPLDVLKKLIGKYQESGENERRQSTRPDYLPPATQKEVNEALQLINPWQIEYDEWVSVLMAIHAEFGEGGLALAESWGQGKPGEVAAKWRSFDPDGNISGRVSIGTLFAIAKRFGWGRVN